MPDISERDLVTFAQDLQRRANLDADVRAAIGYWRSCVIGAQRALVQVHDIASARGYVRQEATTP